MSGTFYRTISLCFKSFFDNHWMRISLAEMEDNTQYNIFAVFNHLNTRIAACPYTTNVWSGKTCGCSRGKISFVQQPLVEEVLRHSWIVAHFYQFVFSPVVLFNPYTGRLYHNYQDNSCYPIFSQEMLHIVRLLMINLNQDNHRIAISCLFSVSKIRASGHPTYSSLSSSSGQLINKWTIYNYLADQ